MIHQRRAQAMSIDLGISVVLFTVAVAVTYGLLENTLTQTAYEEVRRQAIDVSDVLISEGYPHAWTNTTVLRAGIISQDAMSIRKARELASTDPNDLRRSVRATDNIVITVRNATDGIEAITGVCAVGDLTVPETPANRTLPAIAIVRDPHPVADGTNATQYTTDAVYATLDPNDVIIIEGNLTQDTSRTNAQITRDLAAAAGHGITVIIIGDPGVPLLGLSVNRTNATGFTLSDPMAALIGLPLGQINISGGVETEIPAVVEPVASETDNWLALGTTEDGATAVATWTYGDARVWYVATSEGTLPDSTALVDALRAGAQSRIAVPWPLCGELTIPEGSTAIARYDRSIAYHEQILTLRVIVWREY